MTDGKGRVSGTTIDVERTGGLAGFGGPGSRLRSRGTLRLEEVAASERARIEELLTGARTAPPHPDEFVYRLKGRVGDRSVTVEVPESQVPLAVRRCVRDELT